MDWRAAYPLILLSGMTLAYVALRKRYTSSGLDEASRAAVGLAAFVGAMIGSKIPFLLTNQTQALGAWMWIADGKTILGGIFGGYLAVELAKFSLNLRERTGDYFALPVAIAVATGRLGCFVSGCCLGATTNVPWAVVFPSAGDSLPRHPTQLYEVAFHTAAVCILLVAEHKHWFRERRLTYYLLAYLVYRFFSEWIRPEPQVLFGLTAYQIACVVLAGLLVAADRLATRRSQVQTA